MSNVFVSEIKCYYLTKNVLMKIQQNKSFNNLYKCAANTSPQWSAFSTEFCISILVPLGTILEAGPSYLKY